MRSSVMSAAACVLLSSLVACGGDDDDNRSGRALNFNGYGDGTSRVDIDSPESAHSTGGSSWTLLMFMVADNNLEPFALYDIIEMAQVGSSNNFNIIVEIDRAAGYVGEIEGLPDFEGAKRFRVGDGRLQELDDLGELNTGNPRVLADFIEWGIGAYPADKYGIVLWDHGSAWPGFGGDESANYDGLTLPELAKGFSDGMDAAGISAFNFIGFDACLMGSLEIALAMRPFGEYLIASEELEPGHGWDYTALSAVRATPTMGATDFARLIIDGFEAQANSDEWETGETITLSLVDLYNLKAIERDLRDLQSMYNDSQSTAIARVRQSTLEFGVQQNPQDSAGMIDLSLFATGVAGEVSALAAPSNQVADHIADAVLYQVVGSAVANAKGMSAYWPKFSRFYNEDYDSLSQMFYWREFLDSVQTATGAGSGEITFTTEITVTPDDGAYLFQAGITPASEAAVVGAGLYYGTPQGTGGALLFGDYAGGVIAGPAVAAYWDFTVFGFRQGTVAAPIYFSLQATPNGGFAGTIPFEYVTAANRRQDALYVIVYDSEFNVTQETIYTSTAAGYGELIPEAGSKLYPQYVQYDGSSLTYVSGYDQSARGDYEFDLTSSTPLTAIQYSVSTAAAILYAEDAAGNAYAVSWSGEAP